MAILGHSSVMEHKCPSSGSRARVSRVSEDIAVVDVVSQQPLM